ncbi:MAG TPA: YbaK/EbsC family protein, partial [Chloroflexota bacterium]
VMLVVGSGGHPDPSIIARLLGNEDIRFAGDSELEELFPDCDAGAMPPVGTLYGMPVWVDAELARASQITFPTGRRGESVTTSMRDFERLIWPTYATLAAIPTATAP